MKTFTAINKHFIEKKFYFSEEIDDFSHIFFSSFNKLLLQKEELEQKHLHLLQVLHYGKIINYNGISSALKILFLK